MRRVSTLDLEQVECMVKPPLYLSAKRYAPIISLKNRANIGLYDGLTF